jgi:hypothetical protein
VPKLTGTGRPRVGSRRISITLLDGLEVCSALCGVEVTLLSDAKRSGRVVCTDHHLRPDWESATAFSRVYSPRRNSCLQQTTPHHEVYTNTMSSLLDLALNSDAAPTPSASSDVGNARRSQIRSSSARPRGPPSESAGANSDVEGDPDDEIIGARVPGRRTNAPRTDIPKVVDVTGETLSMRFQEFLEK